MFGKSFTLIIVLLTIVWSFWWHLQKQTWSGEVVGLLQQVDMKIKQLKICQIWWGEGYLLPIANGDLHPGFLYFDKITVDCTQDLVTLAKADLVRGCLSHSGSFITLLHSLYIYIYTYIV